MFGTIADILRQRELRKKILFTIGLLGVFRLGSFLPIPFINYEAFRTWFSNLESGAMGSVIGMVGIITAGSLSRATLFSLGIMPYISSSIIFQLLTKVVPALKSLAEEGGSGRKRINQYTRYLTVAICLVQSFAACMYLSGQKVAGASLFMHSRVLFVFMGVLTITTGTMVLMWLGEQITDHGVGNGISIIIMVGIVSRIPLAIANAVGSFDLNPESGSQFGVGTGLFLIGLFLVILFTVVYIYLGKRMIPVQYGRQVRGRREMGGQKQAIWLRVNQAGVIPVIFASALMTAPKMLTNLLGFPQIFDYSSFEYNAVMVGLIIFFSYFYTSMTFNPDEVADNLKEHGSFIPGYRAGRKTADFLRDTLVHITFVGAVFLAVVAILPTILGLFIKVPFLVRSSLFGGTAMLIVIGVSLDLMQKIQEHFYMRDYGGFLKKKIKGRKR